MKKFFLVAMMLILTAPAEARLQRRMGELPAPRLLAPSEKADITGKEYLEFRWSNEGSRPDYYDFRLYKGHETVESGLIIKEKVPANQPYIRVQADAFENGGTYAWSVRQVGARKSPDNYSIVTVKK